MLRKVIFEESEIIVDKNNMVGADLHCADLSGARLSCLDMSKANLQDADLHNADLHDADLHEADLQGADLHNAILSGGDLRNANLRGAILSGADLSGADLQGADLYGAILRGADLRDANLQGANLSKADMYGADLREAQNVPYIPMACPDEGAFIGWKRVYINNVSYIFKVLVPEDSKRCSGTTRICRTDRIKLLEIQTIDGRETFPMVHEPFAYEMHADDYVERVDEFGDIEYSEDNGLDYVPGQFYKSDFTKGRFDEMGGIEFYINRQEAVDN